jgi:hypothetical protein
MEDASVQPHNSALHGVMGWLVPQEVKKGHKAFLSSSNNSNNNNNNHPHTTFRVPNPSCTITTILQLQQEHKNLRRNQPTPTQPKVGS